MDEDRKTSIANALHSYRTVVLECNLALLEIVIQVIEDQPNPEHHSQEQADVTRMRFFAQLCLGGGDFRELPRTPRGLVSPQHRDTIVREYGLDGIFEAAPETVARRCEWFATVEATISRLELPHNFSGDQGHPSQRLPPDLRYLCILCHAIIGPGLPMYRVSQQGEFISGPFEAQEVTERRVISRPQIEEDLEDEDVVEDISDDDAEWNELMLVWPEWDIAVAVKLGDAPYAGGGFAAYCRLNSDKPWGWKYGVCDGDWSSELYEDIGEFLDYYARCKQQTEDQARQMVIPIEYLT